MTLTHKEILILFKDTVASLEKLQQNPKLLEAGVCYYLKGELLANPRYKEDTSSAMSYGLVNFIERGGFYYGPQGQWTPVRAMLVERLMSILSLEEDDAGDIVTQYQTYLEVHY